MLGMGLGLSVIGRVSFKNGFKADPPVSSKDVVLQSASIADMSWGKDLVTGSTRVALALEDVALQARECAKELGTIRQILAEDAENRQDDRTYRRGVEDGKKSRGS